MMHVIHCTNVNSALIEGLHWLALAGVERESRNGKVLVAPGPVATVYRHPDQRVLFDAHRNANPFFHFMEALWMLAGQNDLAWVEQFLPRMREYSDDGLILHGAYGYRWRNAFSIDQLSEIIHILRNSHTDRRAVLSMWSPSSDLGSPSKDVPCNTHCYFQVIEGRLEMTLMCRSNDMLWGAHGANAVHFSMLQEYLASSIGVKLGSMIQFSNNYHAYLDKVDPRTQAFDYTAADLYNWHLSSVEERVYPFPMMSVPALNWNLDLCCFMRDPLCSVSNYEDRFFSTVAGPMYFAWHSYKHGNFTTALDCADMIEATDWRVACTKWLKRRRALVEAQT
jgi:hypothetical protein